MSKPFLFHYFLPHQRRWFNTLNNTHSSIFTSQFITPRWLVFAGRFHMLSCYSLFICPLETMFSVGRIQLPQEKMCLANWHRQGLVCREGWISLAWQWAGFYWHRRFVSSMRTCVPEVCRRSSCRSLNTHPGFHVGLLLQLRNGSLQGWVYQGYLLQRKKCVTWLIMHWSVCQ